MLIISIYIRESSAKVKEQLNRVAEEEAKPVEDDKPASIKIEYDENAQ